MVNEEKLKCISCKGDITNMSGSVSFECPNCGKIKINRCVECRKKSIKYLCLECSFEGPN